MANDDINRLAVAVASQAQPGRLTHALREGAFYYTRICSWGGLVEETTLCLLIGPAEARLPALFAPIKECWPVRRQLVPARLDGAMLQSQTMVIEAVSGGAAAYTGAVERFVQL